MGAGKGRLLHSSFRLRGERRWRTAHAHAISRCGRQEPFASRDSAVDEKKNDHLKSVPQSLKAALRRARVESAEQNEAVADLREAEIARLEILEEAVRPLIEQ